MATKTRAGRNLPPFVVELEPGRHPVVPFLRLQLLDRLGHIDGKPVARVPAELCRLRAPNGLDAKLARQAALELEEVPFVLGAKLIMTSAAMAASLFHLPSCAWTRARASARSVSEPEKSFTVRLLAALAASAEILPNFGRASK